MISPNRFDPLPSQEYEAGDSLRNFIHDLKVPMFILVGLRNYFAYRLGRSRDSAPRFAESIVRIWQIRYTIFEEPFLAEDLEKICDRAEKEQTPLVLFLPE